MHLLLLHGTQGNRRIMPDQLRTTPEILRKAPILRYSQRSRLTAALDADDLVAASKIVRAGANPELHQKFAVTYRQVIVKLAG